jgi:hypothetical protein
MTQATQAKAPITVYMRDNAMHSRFMALYAGPIGTPLRMGMGYTADQAVESMSELNLMSEERHVFEDSFFTDEEVEQRAWKKVSKRFAYVEQDGAFIRISKEDNQ